MRPAAPHTDTLNIFERWGLHWMRRHSRSDQPALSHWPKEVLRKIQRMERSTIIQASILGAVSGALFGLTEMGLEEWFGDDQGWRYWVIFSVLGLVISGAEIIILYWRIFRTVGRAATQAGLDIDRDDVERMMVLGLSRAALDMPNPRAEFHGVDPYSRLPRWKLLMYTVFYRLKVGATSMALRVIMRRVLARAALRSLIPFAAIGVFAFWNALITYWILRQARIRTAGPVAIRDLEAITKDDCDSLDQSRKELLYKAVGESVIRSQDAHPNHVLLLGQLLERWKIDEEKIKGEWREGALNETELGKAGTKALLRILVAATILRGPPRKGQRKFLVEMAERLGRQVDKKALKALQGDVYDGQGLEPERLDAVAPQVS
ncbi:LBF_2804 family protein [Desulfonatronum parangueonense]